MLRNLFSLRQFQLTKWSFFVYSSTHNAPYVHPRLDLIFEFWRTFPIGGILEMYDQDLIIIYLSPFRLMYVMLSSADEFSEF